MGRRVVIIHLPVLNWVTLVILTHSDDLLLQVVNLREDDALLMWRLDNILLRVVGENRMLLYSLAYIDFGYICIYDAFWWFATTSSE